MNDEEFVRAALSETASKMGLSGGIGDEHVAMATNALRAVREGRPEELTHRAADTVETMLSESMHQTHADDFEIEMDNITEFLTPHMQKFGVDEAQTKWFQTMIKTLSEKMISGMQTPRASETDSTEEKGADSGGTQQARTLETEEKDTNEYIDKIANEFCSRVYYLLYKLTLYARPIEDQPGYESETDDDESAFKRGLTEILNNATATSDTVYSEEFEQAYFKRILHSKFQNDTEVQLVMWYQRICQGSNKVKRNSMKRWHDSAKNHYALLNRKVGRDVFTKALFEVVPLIYPLHAAGVLDFWKEEAFAASQEEFIVELEQIHMLTAVVSGLPPAIQRIMSKFASAAEGEESIGVAPDGSIDQEGLMKAAMETVSSLSSEDTMELMKSVPDMIRGFSGPMSTLLRNHGNGSSSNVFESLATHLADNPDLLGNLSHLSQLNVPSGTTSTQTSSCAFTDSDTLA